MLNTHKIFLIALVSLLLGACSTVKPWERAHLAKPNMQGSPIAQKAALDRHIYFSKEGASGGGEAAGGGCGCN
ncbi:MAG: DUF4266 domain-containing protein [Bermanella sp.]